MKSIIYQGWRYDQDADRAPKRRFVAIKGDKTLHALSERAIREAIEAFVEIEAEQRAKELEWA